MLTFSSLPVLCSPLIQRCLKNFLHGKVSEGRASNERCVRDCARWMSS